MAFTVAPMEAPKLAPLNPLEQNQFDLPVKEFIGYDIKANAPRPQEPDATQPNTVEEKEEPTSTESLALSPKISALARKEAAQRLREAQFRQREKSLEARLAQAEKYEKLQARLAAKDYSAADELGMSYEEYTNYLLTKQAGEKPEEKRFRSLEDELSSLKKDKEEQVARDYQANQALWKKEISTVVSDAEAYPEINFVGAEAQAAVLQHINDSFDQDDVELSAEEAAKEIESYLAERALKLSESPTLKKKFEASKTLGPPRSAPKTITNQMTTTPTKQSSKPFHLMSESEQIAEAIRRVQAAKLQR